MNPRDLRVVSRVDLSIIVQPGPEMAFVTPSVIIKGVALTEATADHLHLHPQPGHHAHHPLGHHPLKDPLVIEDTLQTIVLNELEMDNVIRNATQEPVAMMEAIVFNPNHQPMDTYHLPNPDIPAKQKSDLQNRKIS